jgi:hypothetical protein
MSEIESLMAQITELAPNKKHNLSRDMVDGSRTLGLSQARMVLNHLNKCTDIQRPDPADDRMPRPAGQRFISPGLATPDNIDRGGSDQAEHRPSTYLPRLADLKGIPAGYYATPSGTGTNDLDFWRVDVPEKGKWDGFSFARRILGGGSGSEMRTIDLDNIQQRKALAAIRGAGLEAAGFAFATAIGRCRKCGLVLTDDDSRARGMGPTCAAKAGL